MSKVSRLYEFFKPASYQLHININKQALVFDGKVVIKGLQKNNQPLRLHASGLKINKVLIGGHPQAFRVKVPQDELIIDRVVKQDQNIEIAIDFDGQITRPMQGMYPCYGRKQEVIIATQFESHHAREVFPCIDEPEAKAIFSLSLTTVSSDVVLSNSLVAKEDRNGSQKTVYFKPTPKMSTYLLAFVSGPLKSKSTKTLDGTEVNAWATADQVKNVDFALQVASQSLDFFNDYFEIRYPLEKCDLVALPDFAAGAMENWGLITFRETAMLVDKNSTTTESKQYAAMVIAHELAHQWFGNLVTMEWWDDLWLNEGFASWIEFLAIDKLFPKWNMWTHFLATEQLAALRLDSLKNTHPVQIHINHPDEIRTSFDSISYCKGASVIHMLHDYLGPKNFRLGLVHYLKKHAYSNTTTSDLWESLREVSGKPVEQFMSAWTTQAGLPMLDLTDTPKKQQIKLSQRRFLADGSKINSQNWPIPCNTKDLDIEVFDQKSKILSTTGNNKNLLINRGHSGFYVTKYWPSHYQDIAGLLCGGQLPEADRFGLLNDMLALNRANLLPIEVLFDSIRQLNKEQSMPVWDIMTLAIGDVRRVMSDQTRDNLKPFIFELSSIQAQRLGWNENKNDTYYDRLLRPVILGLASSADNQKVVKKAKSIFDKANKIQDIPIHFRHMVLMSVARRGGKPEFDKILGFRKLAQSPEDRISLLNAMLHFESSDLYGSALNLIKSDEVRLQDVTYALIFALANRHARTDVWNWITTNWPWLKNNFGQDMSFFRIPVNIANVFSDADFLQDYQAFFDKVKEPSLELSIKQGLEILNAQIAWRQNYEANLLNWLSVKK